MQTKAELELKDKQFEQVTAKPAPRWPWPELAVLAGYLGLVIIMTWPLALHFTEAVPDGAFKDRYQNLWNFWWVERAVTHFHNPLYTDMIFYPYYSGGSFPEMPLALYTLQVLNGLLMLPLTLKIGRAHV